MEAHTALEYQNIKGGKISVEAPRQPSVGGAVEAHTALEYQNIKGGKISVEAPRQPSVVELWRPTLP